MFYVLLFIKQECFHSFYDSIKILTTKDTTSLTDLSLDSTYKSSIIYCLAGKKSGGWLAS